MVSVFHVEQTCMQTTYLGRVVRQFKYLLFPHRLPTLLSYFLVMPNIDDFVCSENRFAVLLFLESLFGCPCVCFAGTRPLTHYQCTTDNNFRNKSIFEEKIILDTLFLKPVTIDSNRRQSMDVAPTEF